MSKEQDNQYSNPGDNRSQETERRPIDPVAFVESLLDLMGFDVGVSATENDGVEYVDIDAGDDNDLIVGKESRSLEALQHVVTRAVAASGLEGEIRVDVGGRRADRDEELLDITEDLVEECLEEGEAVYTPMLYASERRVIHRRAADIGGVETISVGHGAKKRVRISAPDRA